MPTPEDIYAQLTRLLRDRKDQVYDVEILPPGVGPLFHDGHSVGITKAALVQSFVVARQSFFASVKNAQTDSSQRSKGDDTGTSPPDETNALDNPSTLLDVEVILLFDPEHLTACNWRKRRLLRILKKSPDQFYIACRREITFTTTLLRSPLHRHAKSPTIWQHRFWLMSQMVLQNKSNPLDALDSVLCDQPSHGPPRSRSEIAEHVAQAEMSIVLKSGEQHPMNYYAFSFLRRFFGLLGRFLEEASSGQPGNGDASAELCDTSGKEASIALVVHLSDQGRMLEGMHAWCLAHPNDISGWSFLHFLLDMAEDRTVQQAILEKTVQFALNVAWEGEPLWTFVDGCVARFRIPLVRGLAPPDCVTSIYHGGSYSRRWEAWTSWARTCRQGES